MQGSLEATQLEIGYQGNPLHECYDTLGMLVTETWLKAVWEQLSCYQFQIPLNYLVQHHPWGVDQDLLDIFLAQGIWGKGCIS
jgi:hypothetical protein